MMKVEFTVNKYLLAWYLLYGTSLSEEVHRFKEKLWKKYKDEYNACYHDKEEIIKYDKDYIPNNDLLYNMVFDNPVFNDLLKDTQKHKTHLVKSWEKSSKEISSIMKEVFRFDLDDISYNIFVLHPFMEIIDCDVLDNAICFGSENGKNTFKERIVHLILKKKLDSYSLDDGMIVSSIIELAVVNEMGTILSGESKYNLGNPKTKLIKRQIYPYWLMYLGITTKEGLLSCMMRDKIVFDIDKYPVERHLRRINILEFVDFCVKNKKYIIKLSNVEEIMKENSIEVI